MNLNILMKDHKMPSILDRLNNSSPYYLVHSIVDDTYTTAIEVFSLRKRYLHTGHATPLLNDLLMDNCKLYILSSNKSLYINFRDCLDLDKYQNVIPDQYKIVFLSRTQAIVYINKYLCNTVSNRTPAEFEVIEINQLPPQ